MALESFLKCMGFQVPAIKFLSSFVGPPWLHQCEFDQFGYQKTY